MSLVTYCTAKSAKSFSNSVSSRYQCFRLAVRPNNFKLLQVQSPAAIPIQPLKVHPLALAGEQPSLVQHRVQLNQREVAIPVPVQPVKDAALAGFGRLQLNQVGQKGGKVHVQRAKDVLHGLLQLRPGRGAAAGAGCLHEGSELFGAHLTVAVRVNLAKDNFGVGHIFLNKNYLE